MLVVLASVTTAQRMKKMLHTRGIKSDVVQTPKSIAVGGCGYSLRMHEKDKDEALSVAKSLGVRIKGIFKESFDGATVQFIQMQNDGGADT